MEPVVCFMPSTLSCLHLNTARVALYSWLFCKKIEGKFLLNVSKEIDCGEDHFIDCMNWLGLINDYGPYHQCHYDDRYEQAINDLLEKGYAYLDYSTKTELMREKKLSKGGKYVYSRKYMADTKFKRTTFEFHLRPRCIRLKMPRKGVVAFSDVVKGDVEKDAKSCHDIILKNSDGSYSYEFRQAVDYITHSVTHAIRDEDQEIYAPQQKFICQQLGHTLQFGHIPFVKKGKKRLSVKRLNQYRNFDMHFRALHDYCLHAMESMEVTIRDAYNPLFVDFYSRAGFFSAAIRNYILFMGKTPDGVKDCMYLDEILENFDIRWASEEVSFDINTLMEFQQKFMDDIDVVEKCKYYYWYLKEANHTDWWPILNPDPPKSLVDLVNSFGSKFRIGSDLVNFAA